ncbi:hypothetical protein HHI36_012014 [Cryptolaemus montrouzieri]|uniref:Uncharacterized protein n=1 Tax=Cryptolaemus montrouzieri TaxID=559131 RepID=A0ABD2NE67_9CUCU
MAFILIRFNVIVFLTSCLCDNVIDVDDLLSPDYMPTTLMMLENPMRNETKKYPNTTTTKSDGSLDKAILTMEYHRHMMNEYLCRSYIAEEIVQDMTISRIKKRMGAVSHGPGMSTLQSSKTNPVQNELLEDEGSANYKDWLSKSTTLEDIYRHYDMTERSDAAKEDDGKDEEEDYDRQVAGYGYTYKPLANHAPSKLGHSGEGIYISSADSSYPHSGGGGGYSSSGGGGGSYSYGGHQFGAHQFGGHSGGGSFGGGHPIIHEQVIHIPKHHHHVKYVDKKDSLTELFEIALTALAFLSFGMFIAHVIMCISMTHNTTTTAMGMMMPTNTGNEVTTETGMDVNGGGDMPGGGDMNGDGGDMGVGMI